MDIVPLSVRSWHFSNCLALRQATRLVTQFYDQHLAASGLRSTQYSILAKLDRLGPTTINALADELVMDAPAWPQQSAART